MVTSLPLSIIFSVFVRLLISLLSLFLFSDVCFHYPEQSLEHGLQHISLFLPAGTTTAIVGPTGSGKTSLSRLLFRFYDPQSGVVRIGGQDIRKYTQLSVRKNIGIVPQDTVLFNETILYNIKYGRPEATQEEVNEAADFAQIRTFIEGLPNKWETQVGERGLKLSGGEKQRIAIARCFVSFSSFVRFFFSFLFIDKYLTASRSSNCYS